MKIKPQFLTEGLRNGDLDGLISKTVSIDEYKSKLSSNDLVCVLAISCLNKDVASDLASFVQFGAVDIIDVDIASDRKSKERYCAFIDINRSATLVDDIIMILNDVSRLCDVDKWFATVYNAETTVPVTKKDLTPLIASSPEEYVQKNHDERKKIEEMIKNRMRFMINY